MSIFPAGYDPETDATAVAFGGTDVVSTIFVMPGQQGEEYSRYFQLIHLIYCLVICRTFRRG